jgi:hypothetical protein
MAYLQVRTSVMAYGMMKLPGRWMGLTSEYISGGIWRDNINLADE